MPILDIAPFSTCGMNLKCIFIWSFSKKTVPIWKFYRKTEVNFSPSTAVLLSHEYETSVDKNLSQQKMDWNKRNLNCFYSISAKKRKQKYCFLGENMHQSMSRNWEISSCMLQSPKTFLLISMILTLNCFCSVSANRHKQKDCFLWENMHQSMSRNWEN